ncbi:uncharacterized protein LOC131243610 [Magnolia sinica]|uniref:uncharacterized protein LOC131243610 n=1 Tax=Magnolia sinica TaxID=86752 RepID=UPI00265884FD|nr:uncharacterized protein LOC131243610 [Magnolia sinica]
MALLTGNGDPFFDFLFPSKLEEEIPGRLIINDVLINILSKLPIKSLVRFKCVSKEWQSFISDPSLQESLPKPMSGLFLRYYTSDAFQISLSRYTFVLADGRRPNCNDAVVDFGDLSFFPRHDEISIVDCCNGLVLGLATQGNNLVEMPESDHLPFWMYSKSRYLKETSSNENMIINENMNVGVPYYYAHFSLVAFHPDFEVIFLQTGVMILSYHFNNMDLKVWVSKPDYFGDAYPFSPCLADFYGCEQR